MLSLMDHHCTLGGFCHDGNTVLLWWGMVLVWCVVVVGVVRSSLQIPNVPTSFPTATLDPGRIIGDFKEISSGLTGNLVRKEPTIVISEQHASLLGIQWVEWFYFLKPDKLMSKLGQFPALLDDK